MLLRALTSRAALVRSGTRSRGARPSPPPPPPSMALPFSSTSASAAAAAADSPSSSSLPHLLVFGGNGFVGTRVCQAALAAGLGVVSVSRSGRPRWAKGEEEEDEEATSSSSPPSSSTNAPDSWTRDVEWVAADAFDAESWKPALEGAVGVVSTLGAFGTDSLMERVCGDANVAIFEAARAAGVPRAAFVSVHDYGLPSFVLPGYFGGKKKAERALFRLFPESGVALRPGFVYGTRRVVPKSSSSNAAYSIPLGALGAPLDAALSFVPTKAISESVPLAGLAFVPPVKVEGLARAAVAAVTDPEVEGGVMSAWDIKERYGG